MHLEFLHLIELSLQRSVPEIVSMFPAEVRPLVLERFGALDEIEVTDCPSYVDAALMTNLPFVIPSVLQSFSAGDRGVSPASVGEILIRNASEASENFTLTLGGPGFLNAAPRQDFTCRFFDRAFDEQSSYFFSKSSFVLGRRDAEPSRRFEVRLPQLRDLQSKRIKNDDLALLEDYLRAKGSASADDLLMYLALLGNPEISVGAYLRGIGSSENIPWFLRRFSYDLRRAVGRGAARTAGVGGLQLSAFMKTPVGLLCLPLVEKLMSFRSIYWNARKRRRAELHWEFVLSLVRAWYAVFNRPDCRKLVIRSSESSSSAPSDGSEAHAAAFGALSRLIEAVVCTTRENLEICCDSTGFVLNMVRPGSSVPT